MHYVILSGQLFRLWRIPSLLTVCIFSLKKYSLLNIIQDTYTYIKGLLACQVFFSNMDFGLAICGEGVCVCGPFFSEFPRCCCLYLSSDHNILCFDSTSDNIYYVNFYMLFLLYQYVRLNHYMLWCMILYDVTCCGYFVCVVWWFATAHLPQGGIR